MQTIEHRTIDKSKWADGPWQHEPDKVQWMDKETGFPCIILRTHSGAWCGYVGVSLDHPCFERGYDEAPVYNLTVHGGLTFANLCLPGPRATSIGHFVEDGEDDNVWWLGFDCSHAGDKIPGMDAILPQYDFGLGNVYRDQAYVTAEVLSLAKQLIEMIGTHPNG